MKTHFAATLALGFLLGLSGIALADDSRRDPNEISQSPADNAQCDTGASSGAFGYLDGDNNPSDPTLFGDDGQRGVNGKTRTGPNNSGVCGNRP